MVEQRGDHQTRLPFRRSRVLAVHPRPACVAMLVQAAERRGDGAPRAAHRRKRGGRSRAADAPILAPQARQRRRRTRSCAQRCHRAFGHSGGRNTDEAATVDTMALSIGRLFSVAGKKCVVTGGGRGIGLMLASALAHNGATVYISSRNAQACNDAAAKLTEEAAGAGGVCHALPHDLSAEPGCLDLIADLKDRESEVHCLVNNSGITWGEGMATYPDKAWDKVFNVNLKGMFTITRGLLPLLDAASTKADPARVVNIGSIAGERPQPIPTYAYDTSKAAVHMLTTKLAGEFADRSKEGGTSICVNAIAPGFVPSKMSNQLLTYASAEELARTVPLGRFGAESDMAGAVLYLCSPASAWVTGTILRVDGGTVAAPFAMAPGM
mmetsp:Transcript_7054/g.25090  ORF Transcript_7054/g.25090 Transcript_7054/m.25090 type:complete len:382 (-) Transcript_7054:26-1171(-)